MAEQLTKDTPVENSHCDITGHDSPSLVHNVEIMQEDTVVEHISHDSSDQETPMLLYSEDSNEADIAVEHSPCGTTSQKSPRLLNNVEDVVEVYSPHEITGQASPSLLHNEENAVEVCSAHDISGHESPSLLNNDEVNQEDIYTGHSPCNVTDPESPSLVHGEEVNQEDIIVGHSPLDITDHESPSLIHDEEVNKDDIVVGHSPHDITEQDSASLLNNEEVNKEDIVVGHSPTYTEQDSASLLNNEEVNQEDVVVGHSPRNITDHESPSLIHDEEVNKEDIVVGHSPHDITEQDSASLLNNEEVNQEDVVVGHSPRNITDHESPSLIHDEEVNKDDIVVGHSPHDITEQDSASLLNNEEVNQEDIVIGNSPRNITDHESPSLIHDEEVNQEDLVEGHSPHDITEQDSASLLNNEEVNQEDIVVGHSPHNITEQDSPSLLNNEEVNQEDTVVPHSPHDTTEQESPSLPKNEEVSQGTVVAPHDITSHEPPSLLNNEEVNKKDALAVNSPRNINDHASPGQIDGEEVNQEDIVLINSPHNNTAQESSSLIHGAEVNQVDIVVVHSHHDFTDQESSRLICGEQINQEDTAVQNNPCKITGQESHSRINNKASKDSIEVAGDITDQDSLSLKQSEENNQEPTVVVDSPHNITGQESPNLIHNEEVGQDTVIVHSPHDIKAQDPPSLLNNEVINQEDTMAAHSPHDMTSHESSSVLNNEEVNQEDIEHSPRYIIDHKSPPLIHGEEVNQEDVVEEESLHNIAGQESPNLTCGEENTDVVPISNDVTGRESASLTHVEKVNKKDTVVEHSSHDLTCHESMSIHGEEVSQEDSNRIVQVVNGQEISMLDDSVTYNSGDAVVMYVDNLHGDITFTEGEHADEENINGSFVEIEEYVILKAIHEISSFDSVCQQCKRESPCSYMIPEFEDKVIYLCNGACVKDFQLDYPNQFIIIKKSYVIVEREPLVTKCSECNKQKMCFFCYDGEDINFCSMTCLQNRMGNEEQKYLFNRREIVVSAGPPSEEICFVCDKVKQCVFSLNRYGEELHVCQNSCLAILNTREDNRYVIMKMEKHKVPPKRPLAPNPKTKTTREAIDQKLPKKCVKSVKSPNVAAAAIKETETTSSRQCANCKSHVVIDQQLLNWETMDFCNKICLLTYQNTIGHECVQCKAEVRIPALGKYSLRMGHDIHQFCGKVCLGTFNKKLKTCNYCHRMITEMCDYYYAKFCSKDCVEKFKYMNKMPIQMRAVCAVCSTYTNTKIEVEEKENESRRLCSEACLSSFQSAAKVIHDKCEYCKKYFVQKTSRCFIINEMSRQYHFCSIVCFNVYLRKIQMLGYCIQCRALKLTFDLIKRKQPTGRLILACSVHCLNIFDREKLDKSCVTSLMESRPPTSSAATTQDTVTSEPSVEKSPLKVPQVPKKRRKIPAPTRASARLAASGSTSLAFTLYSSKRLKTDRAPLSTTAATTPKVSHSAATPAAVAPASTPTSALSKRARSKKSVATPSDEAAPPVAHSTPEPIDVEPSAATPASAITSPAARVAAKPTYISKTLHPSAKRLNVKRVSFATPAANEMKPAIVPSAATPVIASSPSVIYAAAKPSAAATTPTSTTMALIRARPFNAKRVRFNDVTPAAVAATPAAVELSAATLASPSKLRAALAIAKPARARMFSTTPFAPTQAAAATSYVAHSSATPAIIATSAPTSASATTWLSSAKRASSTKSVATPIYVMKSSAKTSVATPALATTSSAETSIATVATFTGTRPVDASSEIPASEAAQFLYNYSLVPVRAAPKTHPQMKQFPVADSPIAASPITDYAIADSAIKDSPIADSPTVDYVIADSPTADYEIADSPTADYEIADSPTEDYMIAESAFKDSPLVDSSVMDSLIANTPRVDSLHESYQNQARFGVRSALARFVFAGSESDEMYSDGESEAPRDAGPAELRTLSRILREHITSHEECQVTSTDTLAQKDSATNGVDHIDTTITEPFGDKSIPETLTAFTWSSNFCTFTGTRETYLRTPGIRIPNRKPHELFCTVWDLEIVTHIVNQTNEYVKQTMCQLSEADRIALSREWEHDTTVGEIYRLLAILNYMSIDNRARVDEYWTTGVLGMPQFRNIMSRNRFCMLMTFLHFADNRTLQGRPDERKISKIAPVWDHCNRKFISMYTPQQVLSVDEVVMQFKGVDSSSHNIQEKKDSVVINSLELCEAETGYTLRSLLFKGHRSSGKLAMILDGFLDAGHMLVLDHWHHQLTLARYLKRRRRTDVIGVINRRQIHAPSQIRDVDERQMARNDQIALHCGDIAIIAWMDTKLVTAISTCHNADPVLPKHYGKGLTPMLIDCYNRHIVGRHRKDKNLSMYTVEKKHTEKWYMKIFRKLLNTSFLNTFIIYNRQTQVASLTYRDFRYAVSEGLLDACTMPYGVSQPELPIRLTRDKEHDHFPICTERDKVTGKLAFKKCASCWLKGGKRMTRSVCRTCQVSLCIECWTDYHTKWEL